MKTEIGNYIITSDKHQFILSEKITIQKGDNAGQEAVRTIGFYTKLENLADKLFHLEIDKSDAELLSDLMTVVRSTRAMIRSAGWTREDAA